MSLNTILSEKKDEILALWFDRIIETYPSDTSKFLKSQKDRFANPVGQTIYEGINGILTELAGGGGIEKISGFLDAIIRVRAVQEFTASQAVGFIFFLKGVVRDCLKDIPVSGTIAEELAELEAQIDSLVLLSFDIFMQCREKLYDIKANEIRNMTYRLLQQANLIVDSGEQQTEDKNKFITIHKKEVNT
jgi:hypothetical protein